MTCAVYNRKALLTLLGPRKVTPFTKSLNRSSGNVQRVNFSVETKSDVSNEPPINESNDQKTEENIQRLKALCANKIAELENMRRLREEETQMMKKFAVSNFAKDLLTTVDTLEYAIDSVPIAEIDSNPPLKSLYDGLKMTHVEFTKVFSKHGITRIDPIGEPFNSDCHMALFQVPHDEQVPGTVIETRKPGYTLNGRVLRPAEVGVATKKQ